MRRGRKSRHNPFGIMSAVAASGDPVPAGGTAPYAELALRRLAAS
ncbi:MAG TPA: hypothetical protein VKV80_18635 [Streptosporangiaceae bacterium]|nr:hypothetical protein [Streptosporangiaceae bacterium]